MTIPNCVFVSVWESSNTIQQIKRGLFKAAHNKVTKEFILSRAKTLLAAGVRLKEHHVKSSD